MPDPRSLPPGSNLRNTEPLVVYVSPKLADRLLVEEYDHKQPRVGPARAYTVSALPAYGTEHPTQDGFRLTHIEAAEGRPGWFRWVWANDRVLETEYNLEITYPYGDTDYPRYERTYIVRRSEYSPVAELTPDSVNASLVLVSQQRGRISDKTLDGLFVVDVRIYEELPGPWLPFTRYDNDLGPISGRRRAVEYANQAASLTSTTKTTYEAREGSSIVAWEIEENYSDGTGGAGNPAFPIGIRDEYDDVRGAFEVRTQLVVSTGTEVATLANNSGVITEIEYLPYDAFHLRKVTTTYSVPGPLRTSDKYDDARGAVQETRQLVAATSVDGSLTVATGVATEIEYVPVNLLVLEKITRTFAVPGPVRTSDKYDRFLGAIEETRQIVEATSVSGSLAVVGTTSTQISYVPLNEKLLEKITETFELPGPALTSYDVDPETGALITRVEQVVKAGDATIDDGRTTPGVEVTYKPIDPTKGLKTTLTIGAGNGTGGGISSRTEYRWIRWTFPAYILGTPTTQSLEALDGNVKLMVNYAKRGPITKLVQAKVTVTYTGSAATGTSPYTIVPTDLTYDGLAFGVNHRGVLCDSWTLTYTNGTGNPKWPYYVESYSATATTPSATAYVAAIGTYKVVSVESAPWKAGLYRHETVEVVLG